MTANAYQPISQQRVKLLPGLFQQRRELNTQYLLSLQDRNLLQNYLIEARLISPRWRNTSHGTSNDGSDWHWGWESPTCQLRGHFLGHWLSGAARTYAGTGDVQVKAKLDHIVAELARCQERNGGEWAGSIPPSYLEWTARGQPTWAPHYVIHKTLMGLLDAYTYAGNAQALDITVKMARWFHRWTAQFTREQMDNLLDVETGGMLESWANLYGITSDPTHLELIRRYERPRLFEPLLAGGDPLTNLHANTTIPEAQGAARAYEVTGEERYRRIAEAYWRSAVTDRGYYVTGSQTSGEIWTPPFELAERLGNLNQEHCVVYNMMRLADYLLRWSGDVAYADYMERNLYNGILAQQHLETGMVTYFLPLRAGGRKLWGSPTNDFWCCHGSLVQAHALHDAYTYYARSDELLLAQYIPSELVWVAHGTPVTVTQSFDTESGRTTQVVGAAGPWHRPNRWAIDLTVHADRPVDFTLKVRLPWWLAGPATITVNGTQRAVAETPSSWHAIARTWQNDHVRIELPKAVTACPLPGAEDMVAFMEGPVVLAGLCDEERALHAEGGDPAALLVSDDERQWNRWTIRYRMRGQERGLRFIPLYEVVDQPYTLYFPVR